MSDKIYDTIELKIEPAGTIENPGLIVTVAH